MSDEQLTKFVPIAKVDEEKRMVWGLASDETVDVEGEIADYEATKAAVAEWQQWSNIREMHGPSAVGVAQEIILDDESKSLWIGAKVVDDAAWQKVKEGVYKGFSIGGKALKKVAEVMDGQMVRRILKYILVEISLVDRPANPSARFSLIKREGGIPMTKPTDLPEPVKKTGEPATEPATPQEEPEAPAAQPEGTQPEGEQPEGAQPEAPAEPAEAAAEEPEGEAGEQPAEPAEGEPAQEKPTQKMAGNPQHNGPMMDDKMAEQMKGMILKVLKELGLVKEQEGQMMRAADVDDLRKSVESLAPAEDLQKLDGNLQKAFGDIAKVANAIGELEQRVETIEQLPQGTGPVLRELTFGAVQDQTEIVLKSLLSDATDPQMREVIGQRLAELEIRKVQKNAQQ